MKIFISHSWNDSELYDKLVKLLNNNIHWKNLSVEKDQAFEIATGIKEFSQREHFLREQISLLNSKIWEKAKQKEVVEEEFKATKFELSEIQRFQKIDDLISETRESILDSSYSAKMKALEKLKARYQKVNIEERINTLNERKYKSGLRLDEIVGDQNFFRSEIMQIENSLENIRDLQLGRTGKNRDNIIQKWPNLAMAIRGRILDSDLVIVIAISNAAYHKWIEFEYQEAFKLRKPIFGIVPPNQEALPIDLKNFAIRSIPWKGSILVEEINKIQRYEPLE